MRRIKIALTLVILLSIFLVIGVQAMSSANYQINWLVPLSGGGGQGSSAEYSANITIGQSVIGRSNSPNYAASLGYWVESPPSWTLFLPIATK